MKTKALVLMGCTLASSSFVLVETAANADPVTPERLANMKSEAEAGNWLTVHGSYDSNRYSPLNEINAGNVANLKLAFAVPLGGTEPSGFGSNSMQTTPLVDNGKLYVTDPWGTPYKIDVSSGKKGVVEWVCDTGMEKNPDRPTNASNRGLALWNNLVITNTNDGRVIACDDETGDVVWDKQVTTDPAEGFTGATFAVGDKIIVGQSYGDWATRGYIAALDAATGDEVWRFYTVPEPGQPGSETWLCEETGNPDCWKTGGAAPWISGSYDAETNSIIYGTGNPVPMFDREYRPGDNLYSNSTVSIDADTGELNWYYQYTPGDYHDYDAAGTQLLIDKEINGEMRKVLSHFGRNGFFYTIDRTNGSFIAGDAYIDNITWTDGLDPKTGKPLNYDPSVSIQKYSDDIVVARGEGAYDACPHWQGGVNFWPTSYNETTGLAYGHAIEGCSTHEVAPVEPADVEVGVSFFGGTIADSGELDGSLTAMDPATGKIVKKITMEYPGNGGVLSTPEIVWYGEIDGTLVAADATTLETLWSINVGTAFKAPPMTYAVDGKQYIAITGGYLSLFTWGHPELEISRPVANMLYVFAL